MNKAVSFVPLDRFHMTPPLQLEAAIADALKVTLEVLQQLLQERRGEKLLWCRDRKDPFTVGARHDHRKMFVLRGDPAGYDS